jgi:hypothetical protein
VNAKPHYAITLIMRNGKHMYGGRSPYFKVALRLAKQGGIHHWQDVAGWYIERRYDAFFDTLTDDMVRHECVIAQSKNVAFGHPFAVPVLLVRAGYATCDEARTYLAERRSKSTHLSAAMSTIRQPDWLVEAQS